MIKMKFSVLIPVYNTEKYLKECLQSVLNQNYQDFEIILVDDGSTDTSGAICDKYQKDYPNRIKVIHKENQGQLASRCNAIKVAQGDYVIFADADDLLAENALAVIQEKLEEFKYPDMLVYSFLYEEATGNRQAAKLFDEGIVKKEKLNQMFFAGTGLNNVWTKAVKREIALCKDFDFTPFFSLRCSEDKLYSMVMVDQCKTIAYIYQPLYRYRLFDGSVTRTYCLESIEKFNSVVIYPSENYFLKKWNLKLPEWKYRMDAQWANSAIHVLGLFFSNNKRKDRKRVIKYDWTKLLSDDTIAGVPENPYINTTCKRLWKWIVQKQYLELYLYYLKKNIRKKIKTLKNK